MKTLAIVQLNSIFRVMAIMTVLTVAIAIFPSCKGNTKPSGKTTEKVMDLPADNDSLVLRGNEVPSDAPQPPPLPSPLPYKIYDGDTIWFRVDKLPVFAGGDDALISFLGKNINYPETAKKKKIQGRVVVGFILTKECKITDAKIVTGINPDCDNEALRVVNSIPQFEEPAQVDGRPVSYHFTIPVHFTLQ
jgi:TonB family protein